MYNVLTFRLCIWEGHGIEAHVIVQDVSLDHAAHEIFKQTERLGKRVDILINNAGFGLSGEFLKHPREAYREQIKVNVNAVVELTQLYLPSMVARREGVIINLASLLSFFPFPYSAVYSATKAFVLSFSESLWEEYRDKGIRVLAVCPGPTETNFFQSAPEVETNFKRTTTHVVDTAMRALAGNRSFVIDGSSNLFTALLSRVLPRRTMVRMLGSAMRKSFRSKKV